MALDESEINIDQLLEQENSHNKTEAWNKLNKTLKIQKLHAFSERYGKEKKYTVQEIKQLKRFFSDALEKKKLQKTKEVTYDKNKQEVMDVPGLFYNNTNHSFTIRADIKRISTLKSLTPKRVTGKLKPPVNKKDIKDTQIENIEDESKSSDK
jgi:uncharacterized protein YcbK (DUF882 family)